MSAETEESDNGSEKPFEPTQRKLDEARKRGEVPRSIDLVATAAMAGFLTLALLPQGGVPFALGALGQVLLDQADGFAALFFGGGTAAIGNVLARTGWILLPVALVPALFALALLLSLRSLVFAPEKLTPKLSRISLIANAKQKFGRAGLFEFAKSTLKLTFYATVLWFFLTWRLPELLGTVALDEGLVVKELFRLLLEFLAVVVLIMAVVGLGDFLFQRFDFLQRQRMSHRELREDLKASEGDPQVKQTRRRKAEELAKNRMLAQVPKASVVITNPTHYAVALKWDPKHDAAPICVAKGVDEIATAIIARAREANVPIRSDPPTARALYATVRIGEEIRPEHYAPVAAAIRFAEMLRAKKRNKPAVSAARANLRPNGQILPLAEPQTLRGGSAVPRPDATFSSARPKSGAPDTRPSSDRT